MHRTGCSGFSGQENDEDRAVLKRVLLGYARWNKSVGYCQGFNVIAALLLEVMDRKEDDALKVKQLIPQLAKSLVPCNIIIKQSKWLVKQLCGIKGNTAN